MKKAFLLGAATLIGVLGCATSNPDHATSKMAETGFYVRQAATETQNKIGDVRGQMPSGRTPAQANRVYWAEDSRPIPVGPQGAQSNFTLSPRQIEVYLQPYRYTCDMYTWGQTTCYEPVCQGGRGQSPLWDAYYSAPGNRKVQTLDAALLGIGPSSAEKLHDSRIFHTKPRSWQEFRERMNRALRERVITDQQYNEVFGKYGDENRANLGYAGTNCTQQPYSCEVWGVFSVPNGCEGQRQAERTVNAVNIPIRIEVRNPQLQPFETEVLTVKSGPDYDSITVLSGDKTEYQMVSKEPNGTGATIILEGQGRRQIDLPVEVFKGVQFNDAAGQPANAVIEVDPRYIGQGNDKLMVRVQTVHCQPGGFLSLGDCKGNDTAAKTVGEVRVHHVTQQRQSFALDTVAAGRRMWVRLAIFREGSRWYNNTPVSEREIKIDALKK